MTGVGAVINTARVQTGESVAVFGLGGVGLSAVLGARAVSAWPLIAVDLVEEKLALARELGASHCVNAHHDDAVAAVREITGGGVDHAIESVGSETVLAQAYAATRRGGLTMTLGLPAPGRQFSVPAVSLVAEERTVKGSYMGSAVPGRDIPRYVDLYRSGRLPVDRLLTHRLTLDDINAGFDRLARAEAIRQVVLFGNEPA
jgi:alcohol dehydrogenase